jgi:hypothetical protein
MAKESPPLSAGITWRSVIVQLALSKILTIPIIYKRGVTIASACFSPKETKRRNFARSMTSLSSAPIVTQTCGQDMLMSRRTFELLFWQVRLRSVTLMLTLEPTDVR